jgi:hypothetical protein
MEELHTDSIDGGHEASYGARSRARERAYSNNYKVANTAGPNTTIDLDNEAVARATGRLLRLQISATIRDRMWQLLWWTSCPWHQDHPKASLVVVAVCNLRDLPSTWWSTTT